MTMNNKSKNINSTFKIDTDYETIYKEFSAKIDQVAMYEPKEKYLYKIIDGVPFKDMNTALDIAIQHKPVSRDS